MAAWEVMTNSDVIIVGGGLIGMACALYLARRGSRATVLERQIPGRHASGVNAGGLRQLNRHLAEVPLTVAACEIWKNIEDLVGNDCGRVLNGQLRVAENEAELGVLQARAELLKANGFEHEQLIGAQRLYQLVPALKSGCVGALLCSDDGFAHPFRATTAFRCKAEALGANVQTGTQVTGIEEIHGSWRVNTSQGPFDAPVVVNCAGAWGHQTAAHVGDSAPLTARAPMLMVTERLPHFLNPVVGAVGHKLSFKQLHNGTLLIGGAHLANLEYERQKTELNVELLKTSARTVTALFPQLKSVQVVRSWAGIEGFMPDNIPVIGPSLQAEGVYHAFGFSAHGFQLSPVIGRILSELILDGKTDLPIEPFSIRRFQPGQV